MFCMKKMYFLHEKTTQPPKKPKFCMKKLHKNDKKGTKKSIQPLKIRSFVWKKLSFFTLKDLPASQKSEIVHEKMTTNWQKRYRKEHPPPQKPEVLHEKMTKNGQKRYQKEHPAPLKSTSFAWEIENRPTYGDFDKKKMKKKSRPPTSPNV